MYETHIPRANQSRPVNTTTPQGNFLKGTADALEAARDFTSQRDVTTESARHILERVQIQNEKGQIEQCKKTGYMVNQREGKNGPEFFKDQNACKNLQSGGIRTSTSQERTQSNFSFNK